MAVLLVQIRKKRSFVSDGLFYLGIEISGVKGGSFVKIGSDFFPIFMNTPLIPESSKNTLVVGGQERVLFPARLPRGERRRRQKRICSFGKN